MRMPWQDPACRAPRLRRYEDRDLEQIVAIERNSFPSAWSRRVLRAFLRRADTVCWVIDQDDRVVGFLLLVDEARQWHLANLAIDPGYRRQGLAMLALRWVEQQAGEHAVQRIVLEVRESNLPAQLLYRKAGYRAVAIVRDYYPDEAAYRMLKDLER